MSEPTSLPNYTADVAANPPVRRLGSGISQACERMLHDQLRAFQCCINKLSELKSEFTELTSGLIQTQHSIHQLGDFLKLQGGDQDAFWHNFQRDANKYYGMSPTDLHHILGGQWSVEDYLRTVVPSEIPF